MVAWRINLRQEITREDALSIVNWMEDHEVTRYLNELTNIALDIKETISRGNTVVLTPLFSRNGSFYMICTGSNDPIGFLKLVHKMEEAEMVIVIGDKKRWGHGYGTQAIQHGLNMAFFHWRRTRVTAKINPDNKRSIKAFEKSGFQFEKALPHCKLYSITLSDFIKGN